MADPVEVVAPVLDPVRPRDQHLAAAGRAPAVDRIAVQHVRVADGVGTKAAADLDESVRAQAVRALALIGTPPALAAVRRLRDDPSRHVRACVEGALHKTERPSSKRRIRDLIRKRT